MINLEAIRAGVAMKAELEQKRSENYNIRPLADHLTTLIDLITAIEPLADVRCVVVPKEPTEKQIEYGSNEMAYIRTNPANIYRAMLRGFTGPFDEDQVAATPPVTPAAREGEKP